MFWVRYLLKFENVALFLRLGVPCTPIRHENGAIRKRSSNLRNLKKSALTFLCGQKRKFSTQTTRDFPDRVFLRHKSKLIGDLSACEQQTYFRSFLRKLTLIFGGTIGDTSAAGRLVICALSKFFRSNMTVFLNTIKTCLLRVSLNTPSENWIFYHNVNLLLLPMASTLFVTT